MNAFLDIIGRAPVKAGRDFEWDKNNWTHCFFRALELVIGRKKGIRLESVVHASRDYQGRYTYTRHFHTFEAWLSTLEGDLRTAIRELLAWRVPEFVPEFVPMRGVIAFGQKANNAAITPSGSDRMLIAGIFNISNDIGAVSFGGTACNQILTANLNTNRNGYVYMLKAPATSSNALANVGAANYSQYNYTGAAQSDTAATVDNKLSTTGTGTAVSGTITPNSTNCTVFAALFIDSSSATRSGASNLNNILQQNGGGTSSASVDTGDSTNVATPSAQTQSETASVSGAWAVLQVSMAATDSVATLRPGAAFLLNLI